MRSIQFSGWGSDYIFGQAYDGSSPWPRFNVPSITIGIDYTTNTLRDDRRRAQAENPPLGGGFQPLTGELRQIWALSGGYAWDITGQTVAPAAVERDMRSAVEGRTTQIWLTPHGFIKAAQAGQAAVRVETVRGVRKSVITVTTPLMVRLEGVLNDQNLVERIETWLANPVLGDIKLEAIFSDYKDFAGVKFPTRILQRSAGYPVLDLTITEVTPNAAVALEVPASIRQPAAAAAALVPEKVSDGLWIVPGGAKSIAVEFRDHVVVVDAPETETRSMAVIDAVREDDPGQADQIRHQHPFALRSRRGTAHLCGRRRDNRDAGRQHSVLPAGRGPTRARSLPIGFRRSGRDAGVRRHRRQPDIPRRHARDGRLSLCREHAQRGDADGVAAEGEDADRGGFVHPGGQPRASRPPASRTSPTSSTRSIASGWTCSRSSRSMAV